MLVHCGVSCLQGPAYEMGMDLDALPDSQSSFVLPDVPLAGRCPCVSSTPGGPMKDHITQGRHMTKTYKLRKVRNSFSLSYMCVYVCISMCLHVLVRLCPRTQNTHFYLTSR